MTTALLLDIRITLGFASTLLAILGLNGQAIVKVAANEWVICLTCEARLRDNKIINNSVLPICLSECVNNDLQCKFKHDVICKINTKDFKEIVDRISEKNIFTRYKKYYKYNY